MTNRPGSGEWQVRSIDLRTLGQSSQDDSSRALTFVKQWTELESRALEANAYLSPHFVLPAAQHLDPNVPIFALAIERQGGDNSGQSQLAGIGIFRSVPASKDFPLPHLVAYRSRHSFLSGLLLDRACASEAFHALLDHFRAEHRRWHGFVFQGTWGDGPTWDLMQAATKSRGMASHPWNDRRRAVLSPGTDRATAEAMIADQVRANVRRAKRLNQMGVVTWSLLRPGGIPEPTTEAFLSLEHEGWKGEDKSSLRSNPSDEAFFRAIVSKFGGDGRAIFSELLLDGRTISSTSNFVSGRSAFAFKIGWSPEFAKASPGVQNELALLRAVYSHEDLGDLDFWDSGATEGSYVDKLWPSRRSIVSLAVATTRLGRVALRALGTARTLRRRYRARAAANRAAAANART